jgi:hypothetical protein
MVFADQTNRGGLCKIITFNLVSPAGTLFRRRHILSPPLATSFKALSGLRYPGMEFPDPGHDLVTETGTVKYAVMTDLLL